VSAQNRVLTTVAVGRFEALELAGVTSAVAHDRSLALIAAGLDDNELAECVTEQAPSVLVLSDTHMQLDRLRAGHAPPAFVVVSREPAPIYHGLLADAGITWVPHSASSNELTHTVHQAADTRALLLATAELRAKPHLASRIASLTPAQRALLDMLDDKVTYAEIALAAGLSPSTVKTHFANMRRRLGVSHRRELIGVAIAARAMVVSPDTATSIPC